MNYKDFKHITRHTLMQLAKTRPNLYSEDAVELLCMIAAHESGKGNYWAQKGGEALGLTQIEEATHECVWEESDWIDSLVPYGLVRDFSRLEWDVVYSVVISRLWLAMDLEALPVKEEVYEMGKYAKRVWNSELGKASVDKYVDDYLAWRIRGVREC